MRTLFKIHHKGVKKFISGDYKGAIEFFDNEIEKKQTLFPDTYVYRGSAKHHLGDKNGAFKDWLKAAELGDRDAFELIDKHFG